MSSLPIDLLDNQTLVAVLLRIQSMPAEPVSKKRPQVPEYVPAGSVFSFFTSGTTDTENRVQTHHELGKTIAAELWARGVLRLQLPDVERVLRDAEALIKEATP